MPKKAELLQKFKKARRALKHANDQVTLEESRVRAASKERRKRLDQLHRSHEAARRFLTSAGLLLERDSNNNDQDSATPEVADAELSTEGEIEHLEKAIQIFELQEQLMHRRAEQIRQFNDLVEIENKLACLAVKTSIDRKVATALPMLAAAQKRIPKKAVAMYVHWKKTRSGAKP